MHFYVYIIKSDIDASYYKGYSLSPLDRLAQHNSGDCHYTATKKPWRLVYVELFLDKRSALIRERNLKKASRDRIDLLLTSQKNIVAQFNERGG
jgi:putative endonuclease